MRENSDADDTTGVGDNNENTVDTPNTENVENGRESTTTRQRRRAASRPAGPPPDVEDTPGLPAAAPQWPRGDSDDEQGGQGGQGERAAEPGETGETAQKKRPSRSRTRKRDTAAEPEWPEQPEPAEQGAVGASVPAATFQPPMVVFQPPETVEPASTDRADGTQTKTKQGSGSAKQAASKASRKRGQTADEPEPASTETTTPADDGEDDEAGTDKPSRRRRRRGGRGRGKSKDGESGADTDEKRDDAAEADERVESAAGSRGSADEQRGDADEQDEDDTAGTRRRRRRRRRGGGGDAEDMPVDDPPNTVVHVREPRALEDEVQSVKGSTRLEAKKQRRREGREHGRRRPPIITESEFLARREAVERVMVVRRQGERTQIAVLEDDVLVEHYVDRASHQSYVGNVYLGKVQNVLPSMEAAFVDIGKGRNAVLYAGEVNWDLVGLEGQPRRIESALKSGQSVLVQVTKDPLGHKGARLTSQISLPGRYLVYVPDGSMTGISRKLPDKERNRLKQILKKVMPENAGVIVRTAAEGATEEELSRDVSRLSAQWENIQRQAKTASAPALLYGEPDLTIRVVRDVFNEDFTNLVVSGEESWDTVSEYVQYVAPHLADRAEQWTDSRDVFDAYRIDEQISKALERKVWLPSGGSLVIDRTEAMTVIDVNTGKFTGQGGNLEETVTRNNLEAAEEIVRQLRLRDVGGIIVVDFIDMVLESNRDLVLRRLLECLARDRTKHQVAEVTSLGLVQMTRKRVGQGLLEAFSEVCECCNGRGVHVSVIPVDDKPEKAATGSRRRKRKGEVEKTVERKIAKQESAKQEAGEPVEEGPASGRKRSGRREAAKGGAAKGEAAKQDAQSDGSGDGKAAGNGEEILPEQAVEEAAEAAMEVTETGPAQLESVEPIGLDTASASDNAVSDSPVSEVNPVAPGETDAAGEANAAAEGDGDGDAVANNGRRLKLGFTPAAADVGVDDPPS
jgi:ribonuclease E